MKSGNNSANPRMFFARADYTAKPATKRVDLDGMYGKAIKVIFAEGFRIMINLG